MTSGNYDEQEKRLETGTSSDCGETHRQKANHNVPPSAYRGVIGYFNHDIRSSMFAELQLVILTFCTGIQGNDSSVCFVATLLSSLTLSRCDYISRLPLFRLKPNRKHCFLMPSLGSSAVQWRNVHHTKYWRRTRRLPRRRLAHRAAKPSGRVAKAVVVAIMQSHPNLCCLWSGRYTIQVRSRGTWRSRVGSYCVAGFRIWQPSCPVAKSCNDRNQHGHGYSCLG